MGSEQDETGEPELTPAEQAEYDEWWEMVIAKGESHDNGKQMPDPAVQNDASLRR